MTISIHTTIDMPQCCCEPLSIPMETKPSQKRNYHTDPVSDDDIIHSALQVLNDMSDDCPILGESYFAIGIQSYQWDDDQFMATGPLADLYPAEQRNFKHSEELTKIGFHNQSMEKPSWTIYRDGQYIELHAARATKVEGATPDDASWLYVELEDNDWGYSAIIRSHTRGGLAPEHPIDTARVGVGYLTIYTLLHEDKKSKGYTERD